MAKIEISDELYKDLKDHARYYGAKVDDFIRYILAEAARQSEAYRLQHCQSDDDFWED